MAKLTDFKNPLTNKEGNILNYSDWLGGILWVVMFGMIVSIGAKLTAKLDKVLPGETTPNMKVYQGKEVKSDGLTIL